MMKYTQGPWAVFPRGGQVYIGVGKDTGEGILDAGFGVWGGGIERRDNAERIVACVNAMAGIDDPVAFMADFEEMKKHVRNAISAVDKEGKLNGKGPSVWFMGFETEEARALLSRMDGKS